MNHFNNNKAGLDGLDKEHIQQVVSSSTSSNFGSYYAKRQQRVDDRCRRMRQHLDTISSAQLLQCEKDADAVLEALERQRDFSRVVVHIDMDAFFAAVEMRDDPALRVVPMAVGGESMLSTSNYVARRFGIRSGMPGFIARKLCPELTIVRGNYDKYRRVSAVVRAVFLRYDRNVRMGGLDEACLDITDLVSHRLEPVTLTRIRYCGRDGRCVCRLPLLSDEEYAEIAEKAQFNNNVSAIDTGAHASADKDQKLDEQRPTTEYSSEDPLRCEGKDASDSPPTNEQSAEEEKIPTTTQPEWKEWACFKCTKIRRAYIDSVTFGTSVDEIVNEIRFQVHQETGLTCSAGISANWLLAKVCSDMRKPNGQFRVANERNAIVEFIRQLPVRKVPGIGGVTESLLKGFAGVTKCEDLIKKRAVLRAVFSDLQFHFFMSIALGVHGDGAENDDERSQNDDAGGDRRSISIERTFKPMNTPTVLMAECDQLCEALIADCTLRGVAGGRTATVKIKYASFDVVTRAKSATRLIKTVDSLRPIALKLLRNELTSRQWPKVRLLGVRLSRLEFVGGKTSEDDDSPKNRQKTIADFLQRPFTRCPNVPAIDGTAEVIELSEDDNDCNTKTTEKLEFDEACIDNCASNSHGSDNAELASTTSSGRKSPAIVTFDSSDDEIYIVHSRIVNRPPQSTMLESKKKLSNEKFKRRQPPATSAKPKTSDQSTNTLNRYFPMIM